MLITSEDLLSWLAILKLPQIGAKRFMHLLTATQDLAKVSFDSNQLNKICKNLFNLELNCTQKLILSNLKLAEQDLAWSEVKNHHIITVFDPNYPESLREIYDFPPIIFIKGDFNALKKINLAIVGTRLPSAYGAKVADKFAYSLAQNFNLNIISGLAKGIDSIAHRAVLSAGNTTVAVLGHGLNFIYPYFNKCLSQEIIRQKGALISELSPNTRPIPSFFPRRNRIIAGLSKGVLVVEAASSSGSLITAKLALEYNREIFAVPGSIENKYSVGCHELIKSGAKLVHEPMDVLEELNLVKIKKVAVQLKKI